MKQLHPALAPIVLLLLLTACATSQGTPPAASSGPPPESAAGEPPEAAGPPEETSAASATPPPGRAGGPRGGRADAHRAPRVLPGGLRVGGGVPGAGGLRRRLRPPRSGLPADGRRAEGGDPLTAQEKENLRQLISRRVVEIHASRQTTVSGMDGAIPLKITEQVERESRNSQGPEREFFLESYQRSGLYRPMIVELLREAGLPEQLSWLPLVESGFKARALSSARRSRVLRGGV